MTADEIAKLRPGDIIMWFHSRPLILSYGRIDREGSLHCGIVITGRKVTYDVYPVIEPYKISKVTYQYKKEKVTAAINKAISPSLFDHIP